MQRPHDAIDDIADIVKLVLTIAAGMSGGAFVFCTLKFLGV